MFGLPLPRLGAEHCKKSCRGTVVVVGLSILAGPLFASMRGTGTVILVRNYADFDATLLFTIFPISDLRISHIGMLL